MERSELDGRLWASRNARGKRRVSIFEAMLLQGFPEKYQLCGTLSDQVRQVSDAVPPPLARGLARAIRRVLAYDDAKRP
jgi:DNA (cytosine-5)-methyltransferase 1